MSNSESIGKSLQEWHLRQSGALPESCNERVSRVCLECGTIVADISAWHSCGGRCEACQGSDFRDECVRCRGACADVLDGGRRSCSSLSVFRATGRVAFPERAGQPPKKPPRKPAAKPAGRPAVPPVPAGPTADDIWSRAGWYLGTIVGTAAGFCRQWLDGLGK
jgi:hypothetical protein